jgi:hypothetical protein
MSSFQFDHKAGKVSRCPLCREHISRAPNKWYTSVNVSVKSYEIPSGATCPNLVNGKKSITSRGATRSNADESAANRELLEYYEGRVGDLERQLEENVRSAQTAATQWQHLLSSEKQRNERFARELDARNVKMTTLARSEQRVNSENSQLKLQVSALQEEMKGFKSIKTALEVDRLATEITALQSTSYYRNLVCDDEVDRGQLVLMLAGMKKKYQESQDEKDRLERELRVMRVERERLERLKRQSKVSDEKSVIKTPNNQAEVYESELENENEREMEIKDLGMMQDHRIIPHHHRPSTKMVPNVLPKMMKRRATSNVLDGSGKQVKQIELSNGRKILFQQ